MLLTASSGTGYSYQWKLNGSNISGETNSTYTATASGSYTVAVTALGCTSTCSSTIIVGDIIDPVISGCPANISVNNDAGVCGTNVSWTNPTASDNCSVSSFTTNHSNGSLFPIGTTTVTYTALDPSGHSATCSFDVTVTDTESIQALVSFTLMRYVFAARLVKILLAW